MVHNCSAYYCSNSSSKEKCKGITFHRFPMHDKNLLREWLAALKRKYFEPNVNNKLCSEHFTPDCFEFKESRGRKDKRRVLKRDAIPSLFTYEPQKPTPLSYYSSRKVSEMAKCFVYDCKHYKGKNTCSFYHFPKDVIVRNIWIANIRRKDREPSSSSQVCQCHFKDGCKSNGPTIFGEERISQELLYSETDRETVCAAPGCSNCSDSRLCQETNITFHPFPVDNEVLLKFWLIQMDLDEFQADSTSYLCSEHFEKECFYYEKATGKKMLEQGAVPTKFNAQTDLPGVCTEPTVLRVGQKRRREDSDNAIDLSSHGAYSPYVEVKEVSSQTAISGISTQLILQAGSSVNSTVVLGSKDAEIQTQMDAISALLIENTSLQNKLAKLNDRVEKLTFRVEGITDDSLMKSLTGYSSELFKAIFDYLFLEKQLSTYSNISPYNQFFAFMIYLRTGISQFFLSILFKIGQPSTSRVLSVVSNYMYNRIRPIKIWPSREQINRNASPIFFRQYPNCRVILEVVEFQIQRPTNLQTQRLTFSKRKNTYTVKGLVGKTPSGGISFISDVWPGSISEKDLFLKSEILDYLEKDDLVIADKHFDIREILAEKGCFLSTPRFLIDRIALTPEEQVLYPEATHHRIHYDLATSKYNKFKFFDGQISSMTFEVVNEYFYIVGFLINFGSPLIHIRQH